MKNCLTLLTFFLGVFYCVCSCTNYENDFRTELNSALADKNVTDAELDVVTQALNMALMKSKGTGIKVTPNLTVSSSDQLIEYLISEKGVTGDAAVIVEKCRKVDFNRMHIMLENSVSMQGYPGKGNPNFSDPVVALFHTGAEEYLTYYVGAQSNANATVKFDAVDSQSFLNEVSHGKMRINTSSPIDKIIAESIDTHLKADSDNICSDVFCLITDGIVSGTNAEIVAKRTFTYDNLPVIENRVRAAFEKAYKRGLHCLLYRLETPFEGTYFDYQNGHHPNYKGIRPYFMIFVGDKDNLIKVENNLRGESYEYTDRLATYDAENISTVNRGSLKRIPGKSSFSLKGNVLEYEYNPMTKQPVEFNLEFKLSSLPVFCLDHQYLRDNLVLTYQDNATSVDVIIPNDEWLTDIVLDNDTKLSTLSVCIPSDYLTKMKAASSIVLTLPLSQDEWYKRYSTLDDRYIDQNDPTTFALERLVGGILKGFNYGRQSGLNMIEYKFTMKKD